MADIEKVVVVVVNSEQPRLAVFDLFVLLARDSPNSSCRRRGSSPFVLSRHQQRNLHISR